MKNDILLSKTGRKCLTKCYPTGVEYYHPILMNFVAPLSTLNTNTCGVEPLVTVKEQRNRSSQPDDFFALENIIDECEIKNIDNEYEMEFVLFNFIFDPYIFLKNIYDIGTFEETINWMKGNTAPDNTKLRIHNNSWKAFITRKYDISDNVIDYYYDYAVENWLPEYIDQLKNSVSFQVLSKNDISTDMLFDNILLEKYFTRTFYRKSMRKYIQSHREKIDIIDKPMDNIRDYILDRLIKILKN